MTLHSNDPRSAMPAAERRMATPAPIRRRALLAGLGATGVTAAGVTLNGRPAAAAPRRGAWPDWIDVTRRGARGDGERDDSRAIARILEDIGSDQTTMYFPRGVYRLGADILLPSTITAVFDNGAILAPDEDVSLAVHSVIDAGTHQIFAGEGTTVGSFAGLEVVPQWFGAVADGETDDAPAIRATIDAVHAGGGGTVYLPAGTYLLRDTVGDPTAVGDHPFIIARSGVHIAGAGDSSVLRAADGLNTTLLPGFNVIYVPDRSEEYRVDNASFRNFRVDCNGLNNLQQEVDSGPKAKNCAIGARWGSNIVIDSITVVDNAGRQCFQFGANQKPHTVTNLRITNCYVDTFAQGIEGNVHQNDHSVIYAQADGCIITGNVIVQPSLGDNHEPVDDGTAIELHSKNAVVADNVIKYVNNAINLVATVTDMSGVVVSNNVCRYVSKAFHVWVQPGHIFEEVLIEGNVFHQSGLGQFDSYPYDFGLVDASVSVKNQISDLTVTDNQFIYDVAAEPDRGRPCMVFGAIRDLVVRGNKIKGFPGSGIQIQESFGGAPADLGPSTIVIQGNEIVDCGQNPDPAKRLGVNLASGENIELVVIRDNILRRTVAAAMDVGIKSSVVVGVTRLSGNTWYGIPTPYSWSESSISQTLVVDHVGPGDPVADAIPASVGSSWANPEQGKYWYKDSGNGATGWVRRNGEPTTPDQYIDDDDPAVEYTGEWIVFGPNVAAVGEYYRLSRVATPNASVTVSWTGGRAQVIGSGWHSGQVHGLAQVTVDGDDRGVTSFSRPEQVYQEVMFDTGELADGAHTLTVTALGEKGEHADEDDVGIRISFDALRILGSEMPASPS